nr:hypothetical protein [Pseudonocardia sp. ICBG1034]
MTAPGGLPRHQLTMTVLMTPDMANFSGNVHGGAILKLLDQVAMDEHRCPVPVPSTDIERCRRDGARRRREARRAGG